jgi:O-antigen biosynthesis protein
LLPSWADQDGRLEDHGFPRPATHQNAMEALKELLRPYYLRWLYFPLRPQQRPEFFEQCWQHPSWRLDSLTAVRRLHEDNQDPSFLFLPMSDWHARIQRTQHLALSLAELGHWCFYVNPHLGRQFRKIYAQDRMHRIAFLKHRLAELHLRLPREPVYHHRMLTVAENRALVNALLEIFSSHRKAPFVQIVSLPTWLGIAKEFKARFRCPIVYDCHDLLEGFRGMGCEIVSAEKELMEICDVALFSSRQLLETKLRESPELENRSVLLRNAADPDHYSQSYRVRLPRPALLEEPRVIGYVGSLDDWFDIECISRAAERHPTWNFRLVGRIEFSGIERLRQHPNVEFCGEIPYAHLPEFLNEFDVATIPFLRNDLTVAANPIKLYEYFSCGLPVVSTRLPEVEQFADLVYLADNATDFTSQLERAAMENSAELRSRRREVALQENWISRAEQLRESVAHLCGFAVPSKAEAG